MKGESDRALVERFLIDREESLFRALYREHTPFLYLFALRILGQRREDAEEAVQETWIRAISKLETFRWESTLRTWLCGIALNCCRDIMRKHTDYEQITEEWNLPAASSLSESAPDIEQCVRSLPNGCREVLVLHDIEGYTHREIANAMGISEGTSKSQLFRARSLLRESLKRFKEIR